MIVRQFLAWSQTVPAGERALGAQALAEAWLYSDLSREDRREAELALTALVDDPSPSVRRALAQSLAGSERAPPAVILALAGDQSDISAMVLTRSPLLADGDLVDCAASADSFAQAAIALRPHLSAGVAAALAEIGSLEALIALAVNLSAEIPGFALQRMALRHGGDPDLREAMLARPDLPAPVRHDLVVAAASALSAFVTSCGWLSADRAERVAREACDRSALIIAADEPDCASQLARHLRERAHLTPSLLLRSLMSGERGLVAAALADLAQIDARRVRGLLAEPMGSGFAALYRRAGLPEALLPAFRAALAALLRLPDLKGEPRLRREVARMVVAACSGQDSPDMSRCLALLRRFELEAAREDARIEAARLAEDARAERLLAAQREAEEISLALDLQRIDSERRDVVRPDPLTIVEADRIAPRIAA